jgi:hypothetical protein
MLAVAQHLKSVGHNVTFNTSENFRGKAESNGVRFVAMTGKANYDYRCLNDLEGYKTLSDVDQKILLLKTWFKPALLHDANVTSDVNAWPTPRSWEMASNVLTGFARRQKSGFFTRATAFIPGANK